MVDVAPDQVEDARLPGLTCSLDFTFYMGQHTGDHFRIDLVQPGTEKKLVFRAVLDPLNENRTRLRIPTLSLSQEIGLEINADLNGNQLPDDGDHSWVRQGFCELSKTPFDHPNEFEEVSKDLVTEGEDMQLSLINVPADVMLEVQVDREDVSTVPVLAYHLPGRANFGGTLEPKVRSVIDPNASYEVRVWIDLNDNREADEDDTFVRMQGIQGNAFPVTIDAESPSAAQFLRYFEEL